MLPRLALVPSTARAISTNRSRASEASAPSISTSATVVSPGQAHIGDVVRHPLDGRVGIDQLALRRPGQLAHLVGHDREAAAGLFHTFFIDSGTTAVQTLADGLQLAPPREQIARHPDEAEGAPATTRWRPSSRRGAFPQPTARWTQSCSAGPRPCPCRGGRSSPSSGASCGPAGGC